MSNRAKALLLTASLAIIGAVALFAWAANSAMVSLPFFSNLLQARARLISQPGEGTANACAPLPDGFSLSDLYGTWVAEYFGGLATDKLIIRQDGIYQQIYSSQVTSFESDQEPWRFEMSPDGYGVLHMLGMRRCDDISSICENPGGGLPTQESAVNTCKQEVVTYTGEVVLYVVGAPDLPHGIELQHARLAGSDWLYSFRLQPGSP